MFSSRLLLFICFAASTVHADDWPQWMGPQRDNVWRESGLIEQFPTGGPRVVWRTAIAGGYSGVAVARGVVIVTDYKAAAEVKVANFERKTFTGEERIHCLDEVTGDVRWTHRYPVEYTISYPAGPRCTPLLDDHRVYVLGAEGHLHCLDIRNGEVLWSRDLQTEYQTQAPLWGYAAHPLLDGDRLITLAGGSDSHAVALNKLTGEQIWSTLSSKEQGYSPPTIIEAGGVRQLILARPDGVSSVAPETGTAYWTVPYNATNGSIIMSPIHVGDLLYVGGYSHQNLLLQLGKEQPQASVLWKNRRKKAISPVNVQPAVDGSLLYGMGENGEFYCVDIPTGNRLWETSWPLGERPLRTGSAFIVRQGTRYWLFTEQGELIIARLSKDGHEELDRTQVIKPTNTAFGRPVVWCAPAFANRRVYLRNDEECICIDLAKSSPSVPPLAK